MDINHDNEDVDSQDSSVDPGQTLSSSGAPAMDSPSASQVADRLERLMREQKKEKEAKANASYAAFDEDHEARQEFRRMIDPGILRPNARPLALESLKTLLTIAENILKSPDEPKYWRFKPTNATIKRLLVDPKGTLEYARAMGFNPEVDKFQPFYVFNRKKHMRDLQIGADILAEALEREVTKEEREARAKQQEKAVAAAQKANIKQAFLDDRKSRALIERRERETREAKAAAAGRRASEPLSVPSSPTPTTRMPGSGHLLSGQTLDSTEEDDD
ncbi:hypothetical protein BDW22DRAFT_1485878 [Trametopsis cervina]|nr:hypothetical protein BDW22DRAFT_1485878 [Trametopsis cervina]